MCLFSKPDLMLNNFMPFANCFARSGFFSSSSNSESFVLFARLKPEWVGSCEYDHFTTASTVREAAGQNTWHMCPTESLTKRFVRAFEAGVWATIPFRGSLKIPSVMAKRRNRFVSSSAKPQAWDRLAKEASSLTENLDAISKRTIASRPSKELCFGAYQ